MREKWEQNQSEDAKTYGPAIAERRDVPERMQSDI